MRWQCLCLVVLLVAGFSCCKAAAQSTQVDVDCQSSVLSATQKLNCENVRDSLKEQGSNNEADRTAKMTETYSELSLRQKLSSMAQVALPDDI